MKILFFWTIGNERRRALVENGREAWNNIFHKLNIQQNSVILFCGAKNVGKSSLVRYTVNRVVRHRAVNNESFEGSISSEFNYVYYMDCDPGQPEMTTPGVLSAHLIKSGESLQIPPYLNMLQHEVIAISSVAGTNMSTDPKIYIDTCQYIFKKIQHHMQIKGRQRPIFINTMGHIRNVGLAMLIDLIKISQPTDVIVLNIKNDPSRTIYCDFSVNEIRRTPYSFSDTDEGSNDSNSSSLNYNLLVEDLEFAFPDSQKTSSNNRLASILAYLAYIPEALYLPIDKTPPKFLKMDGLLTHCASSYPLKPSIVLDLLPNSWIHLCHIDPKQVSLSLEASSTSNQQNYTSLTLAQNIRNNSFYGCGIILNLNLQESKIELITPLDQLTLDTKINLIIKPLSIQVPSVIFGDGTLLTNTIND